MKNTQYKRISKCLYCSGIEMKCSLYKEQFDLLQKKTKCYQTKVIVNDLSKMKQGLNNITYPVLTDIIRIHKLKNDVIPYEVQ